MSAQTGDRISSIAARYAGITAKELAMMTTGEASGHVRDIRAMAASLLRQDEVKGLRRVWQKVRGH